MFNLVFMKDIFFYSCFFWILFGYSWNLRCYFWANYSDFSRCHPKWWFSKGTPHKMPETIQVHELEHFA